MSEFWPDASLPSGRETSVLRAVSETAGQDGWATPASMADLAHVAGVGRSTLYRAVDELVARFALEHHRASGRSRLRLTALGEGILASQPPSWDAQRTSHGTPGDATSRGGGRGGSGSSGLPLQELETEPSPEPGPHPVKPASQASHGTLADGTLTRASTDDLLRELGRRMFGGVAQGTTDDREPGGGRWDPAKHLWLSRPLVEFWSAYGGQKPGAHPWQGACTASLEAAARALAHAMLLRARDDLKKDGMAAFWAALAALRKDLLWDGLETGARRQEFTDPRAAIDHARGELAKWQAVRDRERGEGQAHAERLAQAAATVRSVVESQRPQAPSFPPATNTIERQRAQQRGALPAAVAAGVFDALAGRRTE